MKKTAGLSVRMTKQLRDRLDRMASIKERTPGWVAVKYIELGLDADERDPGLANAVTKKRNEP